jgi:hypothetical protein
MEKRFSLKAYSSIAAVILLQNDIAADVIYTDIEDITIDVSFESYNLDMDFNGELDFWFFKYSGTYIWSSGSGWTELRRLNLIVIDPLSTANQVAGNSFSTIYSYYKYWPYAISAGYLINSNLNFHTYGFTMASRIDPLPVGGGVFHAGYWWPSAEDHYLGVQFIDSDSNYHYGWIRCSVLDSAEVLIIKDFAYETAIEHPIVAGDTVSYVGINNLENLIGATVYSFGKDIYILTETFQNTELIISDINGKQIINDLLQNNNESISLSQYPAGIYFVTLLNDEKRFDKKVFIE